MSPYFGKLCARTALAAAITALVTSSTHVRAQPAEHRHVTIVVTHQLRSSVSSRVSNPDRQPGGLAHLAPLIQKLRTASPDLILVDAGGAVARRFDSGSASEQAPPAIVGAMGRLRYDAAALGEGTLGLDAGTLAMALRSSGLPWLGANVNGREALPNLFATRIVERDGLRVGFIGLGAPGALVGLPPGPTGKISIGDAESAALEAATELREAEHADLVIALGGGGMGGGASERETAALMGTPLPQIAGRLADSADNLDLIIASRGGTPHKGEIPRPNRSMRIPVIEPATGSRGLTVVRLDLERTGNRWGIASIQQETLWAGLEMNPRLAPSATTRPGTARTQLAEPVSTYIAGRAPRLRRDTCSGALVHTAVVHATNTGETAQGKSAHDGSEETMLSLLPFQWNWPRYSKGDTGRLVTRRDLRIWISQDDRMVESTLTGRQIALMLQPYVRVAHGWRAPRNQVLFPGGMDVTLGPQRSEAAALRMSGRPEILDARANHSVWMTEYHRFGGGGVAPRALVQVDQPYRTTGISLRTVVADFLANPALALPTACEHVLSREKPKGRSLRERSHKHTGSARAIKLNS